MVQLFAWRSGPLTASMDEVGINAGTRWLRPPVAVLDRDGKPVWQAQSVEDWAAVESIASVVAHRGGTA